MTVKQWNNLTLKLFSTYSYILEKNDAIAGYSEILKAQSTYLCMCVYLHCQQYYVHQQRA